jgi:uncharacterized repeat protein (TIGR03803 family)
MMSIPMRVSQVCRRAAVIAFGLALPMIAAQPARAQKFKIIYSFTGGADGFIPYAKLIGDGAGNFYGTTYSGGAFNYGTVFKVTTAGRETVLYSFTGGTDGANPTAGLTRDAAGNLYGTTNSGGDSSCSVFGSIGCGVVFKVDPAGQETVLHTFTGGTDGAAPYLGSLLRDNVGNLYGTTEFGGDSSCSTFYPGCGTVFEVNAAGSESVLYRFTDGLDGGFPYAGLAPGPSGTLYGTNVARGPSGWGTVFKLGKSGSESALYGFAGSPDGAAPYGGVVHDSQGNWYGTTYSGGGGSSLCNGSGGCGTVFKIDTTGKETVLYSFSGGTDGGNPYAGLVLDSSGNLYGTTEFFGDASCNPPFGCGTVFKVDPAGNETVLHTFTGKPDGELPYAGLIMDDAGNLYGTTFGGGAYGGGDGAGTVFVIRP